ncbi:iron chelate uptake ABC transporter family permease subunit [Angustibacter peucedani]
MTSPTLAPRRAAAGDLGRSAARRRVPPLAVLVPVLVLLALAVVCSLAIGAKDVPLHTVWDAWSAADPSDGAQVVVRARLPRTVAGLLVGGALGLAGAAMQAVARNPLADPGILGVNAGAALAVVVALAVLGVTGVSAYVWFALLGAAVAAVLVYGVASLGREGATPVKLALAGAATTAGLVSLTNALLVTSRQTLDSYRAWQVGSIGLHDWTAVRATLPFFLVGVAITLGTGPLLNGLALGDDVARGLGQRVGLGRAVTAAGVVLLCGAATALAGPIGFVGLVVPHAVRALVGTDNRWVLPLSLLVGPLLVLSADVVGRVVLPPAEVAAGIATAVVGAPVFVALVRRRRVPGW